MKGSEIFKETIKGYLDNLALRDELFGETYSNQSKNIDDCITYILNQVKASGSNGFVDQEIYSMAVHYYEEDEIEVGEKVSCNVVVNHVVELTEEEKQQAKNDAIKKAQDEAYKAVTTKKVVKKVVVEQQSLF